MTNSRAKGAAFERDVAKQLFNELGITFNRDLEQYRASDHGDLIPDDPDFPFLIECKAHKYGTDCRPAWESQANKAAESAGKYPAVIWKFNNHPIRCRIPLEAVAKATSGQAVTHRTVDVNLPTFAYIAREIMADT